MLVHIKLYYAANLISQHHSCQISKKKKKNSSKLALFLFYDDRDCSYPSPSVKKIPRQRSPGKII